MKKTISAALLTMCLSAFAAAEPNATTTVPFVDIGRYAGIWYEIAAIPQSFEAGCTCAQATYTVTADKDGFGVEDACVRKGSWSAVRGTARIIDRESSAKLRVQLPGCRKEGDYWIIDLDSNYRYAMVSNSIGTSLWILSRTRELAPQIMASLLGKAEAQGIDVSKVKLTSQIGCP